MRESIYRCDGCGSVVAKQAINAFSLQADSGAATIRLINRTPLRHSFVNLDFCSVDCFTKLMQDRFPSALGDK